jgi:hypothetical protein
MTVHASVFADKVCVYKMITGEWGAATLERAAGCSWDVTDGFDAGRCEAAL